MADLATVAHAPASDPPGDRAARKRKVAALVTNGAINRAVRPLLERGTCPPPWALLETTGRRTGHLRRTPVGNNRRGDVFWLIAEHGHDSQYVKNLLAEPRVRIKIGRRWHRGVAQVIEDDDPVQRLRWLGWSPTRALVRMMGSRLLTIRIDLIP